MPDDQSQMTTQQRKGSGPIVATGLVAGAFGGAVATLLIGYLHFKYGIDFNAAENQTYAGALHTVCETAISGFAMIGHILLRRFKLDQ